MLNDEYDVPLPEPDLTSYQMDSIGRRYDLRSFSGSLMREYGAACAAAALATAPAQASEPLTDEVIEAIERLCVKPVDANGWGFLDRKAFARAIEAAHGITP